MEKQFKVLELWNRGVGLERRSRESVIYDWRIGFPAGGFESDPEGYTRIRKSFLRLYANILSDHYKASPLPEEYDLIVIQCDGILECRLEELEDFSRSVEKILSQAGIKEVKCLYYGFGGYLEDIVVEIMRKECPNAEEIVLKREMDGMQSSLKCRLDEIERVSPKPCNEYRHYFRIIKEKRAEE